jgi:hypothetical protein
MRADLTFTALAYESNRYRLTRLVAKATRMLHRPNTRVQETMNDAFKWFGCSKPGAAAMSRKRSAVRQAVLHEDPQSIKVQTFAITRLG